MVKMKKIIQLFIFTIIIIPMLVVPSDIGADDNKTLQDLINELNKLERESRENKETQKLTQARINEIRTNIINLDKRARDIEKNIIQLEKEIELLEDDILDKDEEIKSLIQYLQVVRSNNAYLEYAFGAATMTDFIYRISVVEQLTSHNDQLIEDMNTSIREKNRMNEDLAKERITLDNQKRQLGQEQSKLGNKIVELVEYQKSLEEEIADARKVITDYRRLGCQPNERLVDCIKIYLDSSFIRPLQSGRITSPFGSRVHPVTGAVTSFHYGIDVGGNPVGTSVYPAAAGTVALVHRVPNPHIKNSSCGGNYVIINHIVGGVRYATRYLHLNWVNSNLKTGTTVYRDTVIGGVGGNEYYEGCSTGPHLHFEISRGTYPTDFILFREPNIINPATIVNFPSVGGWFYSRY